MNTPQDQWQGVPHDLESYMGFVYLITAPNGRRYIGKKQFWTNQKMKPLKGFTRNRRVWKETDWRSYYGSSEETKLMLKGNPIGWRRDILWLCKTKWEMAYYEAREIFQRDALLRDSYINEGIRSLRISPSNRPKELEIHDHKRRRGPPA